MTATGVLRLRIGAREVAIALGAVEEILRMVELSAVPGAGKAVRGAMNLRGEIVVVLDIAPFVGQPGVAGDPSHYIVIARGKGGRYGFLADDTIAVSDVLDTQRREIGAWSSTDAAVRELVHVDGRLVPLLDPEAMLAHVS